MQRGVKSSRCIMQRGVKFYCRMMLQGDIWQRGVSLKTLEDFLSPSRDNHVKNHILGTYLHCPILKVLKLLQITIFLPPHCMKQQGFKLRSQITPQSWSKRWKEFRKLIEGTGGYFWWNTTVGKKSDATVPFNDVKFEKAHPHYTYTNRIKHLRVINLNKTTFMPV